MSDKEIVGVDDLKRVFIRAQDADTQRWKSISCEEATDLQFDTWAKSQMEIQGNPGPWSKTERASFCNMLHQAGALYMLKMSKSEGEEVK